MNIYKKNIDLFHNDYNDLMETVEQKVITREWNEEGDSFKKFTMYGDYTPVETSNSTTLIKEL